MTEKENTDKCFYESMKGACMCIASELYGTECIQCEHFEEDVNE